MLRKMSQWTAPRLWWARLLEMDAIMMLASEVPRASCCTYWQGCPGWEDRHQHGHDDDPAAHAQQAGKHTATAPQHR